MCSACNNHQYERELDHIAARKAEQSLGGSGQAGIGDQQKRVIPSAFDSQPATAGGEEPTDEQDRRLSSPTFAEGQQRLAAALDQLTELVRKQGEPS